MTGTARLAGRMAAVSLSVACALYEIFLVIYSTSSDNRNGNSEGLAWLYNLLAIVSLLWIFFNLGRSWNGQARPTKMSSRALRSTVLPAAVLIVSGALLAQSLIVLYGPTQAGQFLSSITVRGYSLKLRTDDDVSAGNTGITGIYIGPAVENVEDVAGNISGPAVAVSRLSHEDSAGMSVADGFDPVARGSGPNSCGLLAYIFQRDMPIDPGWNLNATQISDVRQDRSDIVKLDVTCGTG